MLGLIGLSPLSTGHPSTFQRTLVRSSTRFHPRFNLPMDSSPSFGSIPCHLIALFGLAFATATPLNGLTWRQKNNSPVHYSIGTRSSSPNAQAQMVPTPTACRHTVSGSISLPARGSFHLSLTVLVRYRSNASI